MIGFIIGLFVGGAFGFMIAAFIMAYDEENKK